MLKKYVLKMGVKPCPFCGGYPTIEGFSDNPGMYAISCGGIESNKQRIGDLDNGVNTLVHPDANHDSGWKKIRRTKTRYELLNRANAAADALVGKVDNDTNGRATIMAAIQGICNAMEAEGKIQYGNVTESTTVTTDGDTCGFDIEVIDLDSAEHIYLNYYH